MISKLKTEVEIKYGRKITYQKDCNNLSDIILTSNKEYISPATLRRVFGFLATNSNPSRVTLDILSRFVGFKNWEDFNKNKIEGKSQNGKSTLDYWDSILENAHIISSNTVEHIRIKSGIEFEKTVKRRFLKERLKEFTNSNFPATAVIAPGGYGKSTSLAHWYLKQINKKNKTKDVILFISAQMLDQFAPTELFIEVWLMRLLGLKPDSNFLNDIINENTSTPGKLIVIIDALDEITSQGAKQEKIFKSLIDLSIKFSTTNSLKLIVTSRLSTWKILDSFIRNKENWHFTNPDVFTTDGANIPTLSMEETQAILDNTLNNKYANRTLVHEMHPDLREIIAYPYFLQLFIQVYNPDTQHLLNDQLAILSEFLKKQVYFAHFSDEKIDILNKIITLSDYGSKAILKDDLKSIYPIHLKLSGNYYSAYEELNSFGIIIEETQVGTLGGYSKFIRIANQQLLSMLIVQNLIRKEQGVSIGLFNWVDINITDNELQASILGTLFKLAYKERITEPLLNFFQLGEQSLANALSTPTLQTTLRTDGYMRNILIPHYTQIPAARIFLFEKNIDFNHIVDSFAYHLKHYLIHSKTEKEKLFANTLLAFTGFISLDTPLAILHFNSIKDLDPALLPAKVAGIWHANHIIYEMFLAGGNVDKCIEMAVKNSNALQSKEAQSDFAEFVLPCLILSDKIKYFPKFIEINHNLESPSHSSAMRFLFSKFYGLAHDKTPISSTDNSTIEQIFNNLIPIQSYFGVIIGESLRSSYFLANNDLESSHNCFRNAIELSGIAQYKLAEALLMKDLSETLSKIGENAKANECMNYVNSLWKLSGFKAQLP